MILIYDPEVVLDADSTPGPANFLRVWVRNLNEFRNALIEHQPAFILAFYDFSHEESKDFLSKLRFHRRFREVPLVQVSSRGDVESALRAFNEKLGATTAGRVLSLREEILKALQLNPIEAELLGLLLEKRDDSASLSEIRQKLAGTKILVMDHVLKKQMEILEGKIKALLGPERYASLAALA